MMTLALQTSFHDVKSIVKLKGDYSLILLLRLPTKLNWLSAYGVPNKPSKLHFCLGDGPQWLGHRGLQGTESQSQRERERGEIQTKRAYGKRFAGGWTGGELSSGNPCQPGMRSVE